MIVGFSKHGRGKAAGAIRYLIDRERDGVEREPSPTILRGDPKLIGQLIDGIAFKHRYTSGVLSFAPGEQVTPDMEQALMDRFEAVAFAGLNNDQYAILWVRHEHAGHHELNFLVPRAELSTGKSLNIAPPGPARRELFDTFRSLVNIEYELSDPEDPQRSRPVRVPHHIAKLRAADLRAGREAGEDARELIAVAIARAVDDGQITDRNDVVAFLRDAGLQINREGKDYLSVRDPETNNKYRLKGPPFRAGFQREELEQQTIERRKEFERPTADRLLELSARLETLTAAREAYNHHRYIDHRGRAVRASLDPDFPHLGQDFAAQTRHEREILETTWVREHGIDRDGAVAGISQSYSLSRNRGQANRTHSVAQDDHYPGTAGRLLRVGGRHRQVSGDSHEHTGQPALQLSGERRVSVLQSEEAVTDDRDRTSFIERFRDIGERVLRAGARFKRFLAEYAGDIELALRSADKDLEPAFGRYDNAAGVDDQSLHRFAETYRRFELAAVRASELAHELTIQVGLSLGLPRGDAHQVERTTELER